MFDFLKTPIIKTLIRRGVLAATAALATWLVRKGLASTVDAEKLASDLVEPIVVLLVIVYDYSRSKATAKAEQKLSAALNLPAGSTRDDVAAVIKEQARG